MMRFGQVADSSHSADIRPPAAKRQWLWAPISMRNLCRNPGRSIGIGAAMATMAASLLIIAGAFQTVASAVGRGTGRLGPDIVVVPDTSSTADASVTPGAPPAGFLDYSVVGQVAAVEVIIPQYAGKAPLHLPGVSMASPQLLLPWLDSPWRDSGGLWVTGFEPTTDFTILPWLKEPLDRPLGASEALAGHALASHAGAQIDLGGARLRIVGGLERTGNDELDRSIFVQLPIAWSLFRQTGAGPPDSRPDPATRPITSVTVRSLPTIEPSRVANFIRSGIPGTTPTLSDPALASLGTQLRTGVGNLAGIAAVIWLTGLLLTGAVFSMIVRERQRELGLFRAMGATRGGIVRVLMLEMVTVCAAGGALGVATVLVASTAIQGVVGTHFGLPWPDASRMAAIGLLCVLTVIATGLLSALVPALRAAGLEPYVAIHDAP